MTDRRRGADLPGFENLVGCGQIAGARPYQEDGFRVTAFQARDPDRCDLLMVLADGMGGHRGGAEASRLAVSTFVDTFLAATGGVAARLRAALDAANVAIGRCAADNVSYAGMGCTLVACVVTDDEMAHWISVGDSPLWRVRAGGGDEWGMDRLNADHSMRPVLEDLVRRGRMTPEEVDGGAVHQLRSAVTGDDLKLIDTGATPVGLGVGDRLVLASDGLETLPEEEIHRLCGGRRTSAAIVSDLLEAVAAAAKPSQDNATVIVYRHLEAGAVQSRFERLTARTRPMARRS